MATLTAANFLARLRALRSPGDAEKIRRFIRDEQSRKVLGVAHGKIFQLAKEFTATPLGEVEKLLDSPYYEARMGAVSIMDFQARARSTIVADRKQLFELYVRRHDRINNWDLVDRAAPHVVGRYLLDQPRDVLYQLARSADPWERRTAIVSTAWFIREGQVDDTFRIAALLVEDPDDLVQKAIGSWVREAGKKDSKRLIAFLDEYQSRMSRTALRYATEKLPAAVRARFLQAK